MLELFVRMLKQHLKDNESRFVEVDEWCGDSEIGFHAEEHFDMDHLLAEIDKFSASFNGGECAS